jgi:hypothetical protein
MMKKGKGVIGKTGLAPMHLNACSHLRSGFLSVYFVHIYLMRGLTVRFDIM